MQKSNETIGALSSTEMVERVARGIIDYDRSHINVCIPSWERMTEFTRNNYRGQARAAIRAMSLFMGNISSTPMIERVAKTLGSVEFCVPDGPYNISENDLLHLSRAAILSMREPAEDMVKAVDVEGIADAGGFNATYWIGEKEARDTWNSMIDAALGK